jgi:hypothetical protein
MNLVIISQPNTQITQILNGLLYNLKASLCSYQFNIFGCIP